MKLPKILPGIAVTLLAATGIVLFASWLGYSPIQRGPYLQSVAPDSVWVVWDTKEPAQSRVEFGSTPELGSLVESGQATRHHELQITGLEPYSVVYYRVDEGNMAHFRTSAPPEQTSFRFAVFGDTREGVSVHRAIVNRVLNEQPDFVLHTGDMVEVGNCTSCWDEFFAIEAPLLRSAPFFPTLGNHEYGLSPDAQTHYFDIFHLPGNERWYAFDYGNARFISLKVDGYPIGVYYPGKEQLDWLEEVLATSTHPWTFVFFHWGVFTSRGEEFLEIGMRERLVPLFERYGVDAVFMGHNHGYERIEVNGITYITAAGGGASLYELGAPEPGSQAAASKYHFLVLEMKGDHLNGQVNDFRGMPVDKFILVQRK